MNISTTDSPLWRHGAFQKLFWAHVISLIGSGLSSVALALLAHQLVGASASAVLGITLAIRIVVIVFFSPWAGQIAERCGARALMIGSDVLRAGIVVGFFFAESVWQIYVLAFFLNLGAAIFTPVYKAVIPGVVSEKQYPQALALGAIAYDTANILGPSLAGLFIATFGFRGNFLADAVTFLVSAALLFAVRRPIVDGGATSKIILNTHYFTSAPSGAYSTWSLKYPHPWTGASAPVSPPGRPVPPSGLRLVAP